MAKKLVIDDVLALAKLSRLQLQDSEIQTYLNELNSILAYVEKLADIDTTGLQPTSQVTGLTNVMRDDIVTEQTVSPAALFELVPQKEKNYIKVKRMI